MIMCVEMNQVKGIKIVKIKRVCCNQHDQRGVFVQNTLKQFQEANCYDLSSKPIKWLYNVAKKFL